MMFQSRMMTVDQVSHEAPGFSIYGWRGLHLTQKFDKPRADLMGTPSSIAADVTVLAHASGFCRAGDCVLAHVSMHRLKIAQARFGSDE